MPAFIRNAKLVVAVRSRRGSWAREIHWQEMDIVVSVWEGKTTLCCFSLGSIRLPWKYLLTPLTKIRCFSHGWDVSFLFCSPQTHLELCPALGPPAEQGGDLPLSLIFRNYSSQLLRDRRDRLCLNLCIIYVVMARIKINDAVYVLRMKKCQWRIQRDLLWAVGGLRHVINVTILLVGFKFRNC